jgi:starch synthase
LAAGTATGFLFDDASAESLWHAAERALELYRGDPDTWRRLATAGMSRDFSWEVSARSYVQLYQDAIADRHHAMHVASA